MVTFLPLYFCIDCKIICKTFPLYMSNSIWGEADTLYVSGAWVQITTQKHTYKAHLVIISRKNAETFVTAVDNNNSSNNNNNIATNVSIPEADLVGDEQRRQLIFRMPTTICDTLIKTLLKSKYQRLNFYSIPTLIYKMTHLSDHCFLDMHHTICSYTTENCV